MKRNILILLISIVILTTGITTAYYNTASYGYDDAVVFSVGEGEATLLGEVIYYRDLKKMAQKMVDLASDNLITI